MHLILRSLAILFFGLACSASFAQTQPEIDFDQWIKNMRAIHPGIKRTFKIDQELVKAAGIEKISTRHLDLYTDVRDLKRMTELAVAFDQAIAQWCEYFEIPETKAENWRLRAFLIADRNDPLKFKKSGLMPAGLPEFHAGFQRQHDLWLYLQPGDYYTRHLLLHEGTHGFMLWFLGGYGSPWYGEGMAEWLSVHQWRSQRLKIKHRVRDRSEAPYWGRVKLIKQERDSGNGMTLDDVLAIPATAFLDVRYYAWSWAACEFFANHEKSKATFDALPMQAKLNANDFNRNLKQQFRKDWKELSLDWELFIAEMEYGYDVARARTSSAELVGGQPAGSSKFKLQSNRGWQLTNIKVKRGDRFQISGTGEFVVRQFADQQKPWNCQSNGITIEYYQGKPLGQLVAGVIKPDATTAKMGVKGLLDPIAVGLSGEFTAPTSGTLCLRINESPASLEDNQGGLEVTVEKLK